MRAKKPLLTFYAEKSIVDSEILTLENDYDYSKDMSSELDIQNKTTYSRTSTTGNIVTGHDADEDSDD